MRHGSQKIRSGYSKGCFYQIPETKRPPQNPGALRHTFEIYEAEEHFDIESLYIKMKNKNYRVSRATLYNTIELLLECGLVRKHQFGSSQAHYEKSFFDRQHDHIIFTDSGDKEFCDPRIEIIKRSIEDIFDIQIYNHSLYFYGTKKAIRLLSNNYGIRFIIRPSMGR